MGAADHMPPDFRFWDLASERQLLDLEPPKGASMDSIWSFASQMQMVLAHSLCPPVGQSSLRAPMHSIGEALSIPRWRESELAFEGAAESSLRLVAYIERN